MLVHVPYPISYLVVYYVFMTQRSWDIYSAKRFLPFKFCLCRPLGPNVGEYALSRAVLHPMFKLISTPITMTRRELVKEGVNAVKELAVFIFCMACMIS